MRTLLTILASISLLAFAGCADNGGSSAKSPWAAGARKPAVAKKATPAPEARETAQAAPASKNENPWASPETRAKKAEAKQPEPVVASSGPLLASYPELRRSLEEKSQGALEDTKDKGKPLPLPEDGKARIVAYNAPNAVVAFDTAQKFQKRNRVFLTKGTQSTLVEVITVEGDRVIAEEVLGVKNGPVLVPGDEVVCGIYVSPEDMAAIKAANAKSQKNESAATEAVEEDGAEEGEDEYVE